MRTELRQVFQLFKPYGTHVGYCSLVDLVGQDGLETLSTLKLLIPTQRRSEAFCESCDDPHLLHVYTDESGNPFVVCSQSVDRQYLDSNELLAYSLNVRRLLDLFLDAEGVEPSQVHIKQDGVVWELGSIEIVGAAQHLFFVCGLDELREENVRTANARNNPTILFLSDPEGQTATCGVHTVPVLDLINNLDADGIQLDETAEETCFRRDYAVDGEKSLRLDEHVVLMIKDKKLLFQNRGFGQFVGTLAINSQAVRMIEFLYNARHKDDPTVSLADLAEHFASGNKQTISGYKKQINDATGLYGTKEVIGKDGRDRYRLNPYLDCCK